MKSFLDRCAGFSLDSNETVLTNLNLLRETQRVRVSQSHKSLYLVVVSGLVYILALWDDAPRFNLVTWIGLIALTAICRALICRYIERRLGRIDIQDLYRNELLLFFSSVVNTLVVGSGFWWVGISGTERTVFAITMLSCIYGIGTTINSSVRFGSFPLFLILNMGQGILFLSGVGHDPEPEVSVALIAITILLVQFGKRNAAIFSESILSKEEIGKQNLKLEQDKVIIEQALAAAKEANEDKSRFLAAASHDLRQPLHAMTLFLAALRNTVVVPKAHQILDRVEDTVNTLNSQFNNLLDLSKFDAGVVETHYSHFALKHLLKSIVESMRPDAMQKNLELTLNSKQLQVHSDFLLLDRLIRNIIFNAISYTDSGFVEVRAEAYQGEAIVTIRDSGLGIPRHVHKRIFDDFYQFNNPARKKEKGSGLGLAIVKRISDLLDLRIALDSALGKGSTFRVHIPLSVNEQPALSVNHSNNTRTQEKMPELNILIIDDDQDIQDALVQLINTWGCTAVRAVSLDEVRRLQSATRIDFAIVDDMLGGGESGLDIALKLVESLDKNRVIIVTGNVIPRRLTEIRQHGFALFMKPLDPRLLFETIAAQL